MPMMPEPQPTETSKEPDISTTVPAEPTAVQDIAATDLTPTKGTTVVTSSSSSMGKPVRDSSWLELEICRDFVRSTCPRGEQCRFAHPDQTVVTKENKVTCCYDFLKDRCFREHCKYFHPPAHIKERLVTAGKQFGAMMSSMYYVPAGAPYPPLPESACVPLAECVSPPWVPERVPPPIPAFNQPENLMPFTNYFGVIGFDGSCVYQPPPPAGLLPAAVMSPFGTVTDRLHICPEYQRGQCNVELCPFVHPGPKVRQNFDSTVTVCHDYLRGSCSREWCRYYHPPQHISNQLGPQPAALHSIVTPQGVFIASAAAVPASMPAPVFPTSPVMYPTPLSITGGAAAQSHSVNPFTVTSPVAAVSSVPFIPGLSYVVDPTSAAAGPMSAMPVMMTPYSSSVTATVIPVQSITSPMSVIQPPSSPSINLVTGHQAIPTE